MKKCTFGMCLCYDEDKVDNCMDIPEDCAHYQRQQKAIEILYSLKNADTPIKIKRLDELISLIEGK